MISQYKPNSIIKASNTCIIILPGAQSNPHTLCIKKDSRRDNPLKNWEDQDLENAQREFAILWLYFYSLLTTDIFYITTVDCVCSGLMAQLLLTQACRTFLGTGGERNSAMHRLHTAENFAGGPPTHPLRSSSHLCDISRCPGEHSEHPPLVSNLTRLSWEWELESHQAAA